MFWRRWFCRNPESQPAPSQPQTFSLPAPLPQWPQGQGFASGKINLGGLEVTKVSNFKFIWGLSLPEDKTRQVLFYKPVDIPDGFHSLGHYCQFSDQPLRGFLLAAQDVTSSGTGTDAPALEKPVDITEIWSSKEQRKQQSNDRGFFWIPQPPDGYKSVGFLVTNTPDKPDLNEVRCVRADLTDRCETYKAILSVTCEKSSIPLQLWSLRPSDRGVSGRGVSVGTFYCCNYLRQGEELSISCLRNLDPTLHAMPDLNQIHALITHFGPALFFHPGEVYLPCSVSWYFKNGALLYKKGELIGDRIESSGSNLPNGGCNDGEFWIDVPANDLGERLRHGSLENAKLYVHVKPALGGTFTDIVMWVFCPFNGPAKLKLGILNLPLGKTGQHVGDWEHFTLRICNFAGELWAIYFSQHSGGQWVDAYNLEYIEGNRAMVYSSKNGHANYPHPGTYLQGSAKLGIGIRNDALRSDLCVNSSTEYEVVAAEYLGDAAVHEPCWLQYMRQWGPKIVYGSRIRLDKVIKRLPGKLKCPAERLFSKFPVELFEESGPTGPKEKNNWMGDERD